MAMKHYKSKVEASTGSNLFLTSQPLHPCKTILVSKVEFRLGLMLCLLVCIVSQLCATVQSVCAHVV